MNTEPYTVSISGCDASTDMNVTLTAEQVRQLRALSALSRRTSSYDCEPTMYISKGHTEKEERK